jgi:lysophospholipase L1-like esterase
MGVNGADVPAYLRSELMEQQVSLMDPALVIISLGTNDAYVSSFNPEEYRENLNLLIDRIRDAVPKASIILTTPGDSYRARRYYNYNNVKAREVLFEIAKQKNLGIWDFFTVMGGPNSIYRWFKAGLATNDKLHLTQAGYKLQGDLFYEALLKAYHTYLENRPGK